MGIQERVSSQLMVIAGLCISTPGFVEAAAIEESWIPGQKEVVKVDGGTVRATALPVLTAAAPGKELTRIRDVAGIHFATFVPNSELPMVKSGEEIQLDSDLNGSDVQQIQKLIATKQYDSALKQIESLQQRQPRNAGIFILKGAVFLSKNDLANARKSFDQALVLKPNSMAAVMNLGRMDLREKNPDAARRRFQAILAVDQANVEAMAGLAGVAAATGQETEYVSWLEKAAKTSPSLAGPRVLLANYYLMNKDVQKALGLAQEAYAASPNNPQALDVLGMAQLAIGQKASAVATYTKLAKLGPNDPLIHYKLATAQIGTQNISEAKASLNRALTLKADFLEAKVLLIDVELRSARYRDALRIAKDIQKQRPKSAIGSTLEGDILMAQKQFALAQKAYEKAYAIDKSGPLALKMHQALAAAGKDKDAEASVLGWLKQQPGDLEARFYLAMSYIKTGQSKQAIEQLQLLLQSDPNNAAALNDLAWLYQQQRDSRARATAEKAYQLKPNDPEYMDTLGWIYVEQGDTARGLELLRKAADAPTASPGIHYHLAVVLAKSGENVQARKRLERLLDKSKAFPQRAEAEALLKQLQN